MISETLKDVKESGIEWLNIFAVDNVLQKIKTMCAEGTSAIKSLSAELKASLTGDKTTLFFNIVCHFHRIEGNGCIEICKKYN